MGFVIFILKLRFIDSLLNAKPCVKAFICAGAVIHTLCSITMTIHMLRTLNLFNTVQIYQVTAGVIGVFLLLYGVSYMITARTYMKIVK